MNCKTKTTYDAPLTRIIEVKMEGLIAASPDGSWDKSIKDGTTWGDDGDDYGME